MKLYEMEGFLRGKCVPGDMLVNETDAQYLVRKFTELNDRIEVTTAALREKTKQCDELALKLKDVVMVRDAIAGVAEERREFIVNGVEMNFISLPKDCDADKATAMYSRCLLKPNFACDAFLREVRAQGVEAFAAYCQKRHSEMMKTEPNEPAINQAIAATRRSGELALWFAAELRQGGAA
ncbi:hypothetical protein ACU9CW_001583 [Cronobacter dublinensis]